MAPLWFLETMTHIFKAWLILFVESIQQLTH